MTTGSGSPNEPSAPSAASAGAPVLAPSDVIRRSQLTCPGHSAKMMAHAAASAADQVMFDLEDACAVSQKEAARATVAEALNTLDFGGKTRTFRPNAIASRFFYRDLITVVEAAGRHLDGVVIPKVDGPADVLFVGRFLTQIELQMGYQRAKIRIRGPVDSAEAVLHAEQIAKATPRMSGLIFGLVDYAGDIGARQLGAEQFFYYNYAQAKTIAAARAARIRCVDAVTLAIRDRAPSRRADLLRRPLG